MPPSLLPQFFLIFSLLSVSVTISATNFTQCLDDQKSLLRELKKELIFDSFSSTKLLYWNETDDCCSWLGVECDAAGYVISLQLENEGISGGIGESSSLFKLKYLEKLNLEYNDFESTQIPRGIQNLSYLTHLNLAYAFSGQVPLEFLSLKRLVSLDISSEDAIDNPLKLEFPNLEMLVKNLRGLRELYLDGVNISSQKSEWSHIISSYLPEITNLSLRYCRVSGPIDRSLSQLRSLSVLQLDGNNLASDFFNNFFNNFSNLTTLSLSDCSLNGSLPEMIFRIPTLQDLFLYNNQLLSGSIPPIPSSISNLKNLDLSKTNLSGSLPSSIRNLESLSSLFLSSCQFTGPIPSTLANLTELQYLDLSGNFFTGSIPSFLLSLPKLVFLDLSYNHLSVDVNKINTISYGFIPLRTLGLASCKLYGIPEFINHSDISDLDLSSNRIAGEVPSWIWGAQIFSLNFSSNLLTGLQKPFRIPTSLYMLDLSSNQLRGELHLPNASVSNLVFLSIANNSLSGSIPTSLCIPRALVLLDLSLNKLTGKIPPCLLQNNEYIEVFNLFGNNISGPIPDMFTLNCRLQILDLHENTLQGEIPKSLESCKSLKFMNVGNNIINDTFPCMLSSNLRVLVLRSNRFHGEVRCRKSMPNLQIVDISSNGFSGSLESINISSWKAMALKMDPQLRSSHPNIIYNPLFDYPAGVALTIKGLELKIPRIWPDLIAIDFSSNNFQGEIPHAIYNLSSLYLLNLSHNALHGGIPELFGKLGQLESLDLSQNQLTGSIPLELAGLTFLSLLNLSYNKLGGVIPNGRQFQTFSADSFKGNPGLCGFPLSISCSNTDGDDMHENVDSEREIEWEYVFTALGYVVGFGTTEWFVLR